MLCASLARVSFVSWYRGAPLAPSRPPPEAGAPSPVQPPLRCPVDAPGLLVALLGLGLILVGSWLVVVCQRAALVRAELAGERGRRERAERNLAVRRGTVARLAEVARAGWREDGAFTARGTVPIKQRR